MAILSDKWVRDKALSESTIEPFVEAQRRDGCTSYGLSSFGYDARVADNFKIFITRLGLNRGGGSRRFMPFVRLTPLWHSRGAVLAAFFLFLMLLGGREGNSRRRDHDNSRMHALQ